MSDIGNPRGTGEDIGRGKEVNSKKKLDRILTELEKDYSVSKAKDFTNDERIPTGVFGLDMILNGGISRGSGGHIIEFFGAESSCKSTFALKTIANYQKMDMTCAFIDGENSYDSQWAEILGIDNDNLIVVKPTSLEEMGEILVKLVSKEVDLIVVDSIVSFIPEDEVERDMNAPTMALGARINALITRKINQAITGKKVNIIFINQLREKIGVMYGDPYTTGGGRALKHLYHTRIKMQSGKPIDIGSGDNKERIGYEINLKCVKNKKGMPHKTALVDFYFTGNIENRKPIFFTAIKHNIIQLEGKTYTYEDKKIVGKDKMIESLTEKDWKNIEKEIWKKIK
jgi:recombination protein RecA